MNFVLLLIILSITACNNFAATTESKITQEQCIADSRKVLISKVDNCSVYRVYYREWYEKEQACQKQKEWNNFLYTTCPKDSVTWDCGKNCEQNNSTHTMK